MTIRRLLASLAVYASVCVFPLAAHAQNANVPFRTITSNISGLASAATITNLAGQSSCTTTISGTWQGALQFRESNDGVHWVQVTAYPDPGSGSASTNQTTSNGTWTAPIGSNTQFQVYFSAWTSGIANTIITCGSGTPPTTANVTASLSGGTVTTTPSGGVMPVAGLASPGAPSGGVLSVQGVSSGTNLNVNCASGCNIQVPWNYYIVPASATCVTAPCIIKGSSGVFGGLINESTAQQPAGNCTWYDSASTASGNILYIETTIGAGQILTMPLPGISMSNGLVIQCAANPGGNGLLVLYR